MNVHLSFNQNIVQKPMFSDALSFVGISFD